MVPDVPSTRSRLESLVAMRGLRIGARLAVGFSTVVGLMLALVILVAVFGHVQREALAAGVEAVAGKDAWRPPPAAPCRSWWAR